MKIKPQDLNPDFARFCQETREDREAVFTRVAEQKQASAVAIEKDFYVCRTIDAIFHGLPFQPKPFFKGGTSLSKGHDLIRRFSEDVDIVLSAPGLGFSGAKDPASPGITKSMLKKVLSTTDPEALPHKLKAYTGEKMLKGLAGLLPDCTIEVVDTPDQYGAALQVKYESVLGVDANVDGYISRAVLIETGGRSAREPCDKCDIVPYIQDSLDGNDWNLTSPAITLIKPERTFWDKVYITDGMCRAHAAGKLNLDNADRKSRHQYDLAMMFGTDVGARAVADAALGEKVRLAFRAPDDAVPGNLQVVPSKEVIDRLRRDYDRGTSRMIFGDPPTFDWILEELKRIEAALND